jgi:hypothetical protein
MKTKFIILLWLFMLLGGCSLSTPVIMESPGVALETPELLAPTHTSSATTEVSPSTSGPKNPTAKPTKAILTPDKTLTPTRTKTPYSPLATPFMLSEVTKDTIRKMILENGSCKLPCLWGQTPEKTIIRSFQKFADQFEVINAEDDIYMFTFYSDSGGFLAISLEHTEDTGDLITNSVGLEYWTTGKAVEALSLSAEVQIRNEQVAKTAYGHPSFQELLKYYYPSQILSNYGKPSQVLILPFMREPEEPPNSRPPFNIVLVYQDQGFFIEYIQPRSETDVSIFGCPKEAGFITLVTWNPERQLPLEQVVNNYYSGSSVGSLNYLTLDHFLPIEQATSMTLEEFYQSFKDDPQNEACIETPKELWQDLN